MLATILAFGFASGLYGPAEQPRFSVAKKLLELDGLPIRVSHPKGAKGPLPVFVFSHGMYGSRTGYDPLVDSVAANGYLVIQPSHADSVSRMSPEDRRSLLRSPNTNSTENWRDRPGEVSKCIDKLDWIAGQVGAEADVGRIAVGGHSFGAWTTQALAGMELKALGKSWTFTETRAKAYVVLSPTGVGGLVDEAALKLMRGPMLMVTGTNDKGRRGESGESRRKAFDLSQPGDRWLVWIEGAAHNFGGLTGEQNEAVRTFLRRAGSSADQNPRHASIAKSAVVAFLDAVVKKDLKAGGYLRDKDLELAGGVKVFSK